MIKTVKDAVVADGIPTSRVCDALGYPRSSLYRHTRQSAAKKDPKSRAPKNSPRRLGDDERVALLAVLDSDEFVDQPPRQVYAVLASRGTYLASIRTMYRLLRARGPVRERRRGHVRAMRHEIPRLTATAPNQVWTWDITLVPGPDFGVFYAVYWVIDLFSRYVVGWAVYRTQSAANAMKVVEAASTRHRCDGRALTLHSDRGSPMTATKLNDLLDTLGISRSLSRPRVSNDNAHVESAFKTMKYQPDFPARFERIAELEEWLTQFVAWYHDHHHHSGLELFTPGDVFYGRVETVAAVRQRALDAAYALHPERFVNGPPRVRRPRASVTINPLPSEPVIELSSDGAAVPSPKPLSDEGRRAQAASRAAKPASGASGPLTSSSTVAPSTSRG